jgi:hypothetical protein
VDDQGWLHVAYYQNDDGATDGGVLNAHTANVYYILSTDGGSTWSPPVQVNAAATALNLDDPPPDRSAVSYYLYGDYQQLRATGAGADTTVYVLWSQYDQDRLGDVVGDAPTRVYCTKIAAGASVTTTSTTTTTTTSTTTTTTPAKHGCGAGSPTFASLDCRFDALSARLDNEGDLGKIRAPLLEGTGAARANLGEAQTLDTQGRRKQAKGRLRKAIHDVQRVLARLHSRAARRTVPAETLQGLVSALQPLVGDLRTLSRSLAIASARAVDPA